METHAIERCDQFIYRKQDIAVLTDNQVAITALSSTISSSKIVLKYPTELGINK